jgi:hypothetical protein
MLMLRKLAVTLFAICAVGGSQERITDIADLKLRVAVDLVQVDAVVTDSHGKHVTGLSSADFELLLDGSPRP